MTGPRKRILLHACCAPDAAVVIERLANEYEIAVFFFNPNIHSKDEYHRRLAEMVRVAEVMGVQMVGSNYDEERWFQLTRGLESEPERGHRCDVCFEMRLRETAEKACGENFDLFGTVLTVSPHKDARKVNEIGERISSAVGIPFLEADFKKKDGFKRSMELSRQLGLYRQDYCGCIYSRRERERQKQIKHGAEEAR